MPIPLEVLKSPSSSTVEMIDAIISDNYRVEDGVLVNADELARLIADVIKQEL